MSSDKQSMGLSFLPKSVFNFSESFFVPTLCLFECYLPQPALIKQLDGFSGGCASYGTAIWRVLRATAISRSMEETKRSCIAGRRQKSYSEQVWIGKLQVRTLLHTTLLLICVCYLPRQHSYGSVFTLFFRVFLK